MVTTVMKDFNVYKNDENKIISLLSYTSLYQNTTCTTNMIYSMAFKSQTCIYMLQYYTNMNKYGVLWI